MGLGRPFTGVRAMCWWSAVGSLQSAQSTVGTRQSVAAARLCDEAIDGRRPTTDSRRRTAGPSARRPETLVRIRASDASVNGATQNAHVRTAGAQNVEQLSANRAHGGPLGSACAPAGALGQVMVRASPSWPPGLGTVFGRPDRRRSLTRPVADGFARDQSAAKCTCLSPVCNVLITGHVPQTATAAAAGQR